MNKLEVIEIKEAQTEEKLCDLWDKGTKLEKKKKFFRWRWGLLSSYLISTRNAAICASVFVPRDKNTNIVEQTSRTQVQTREKFANLWTRKNLSEKKLKQKKSHLRGEKCQQWNISHGSYTKQTSRRDPRAVVWDTRARNYPITARHSRHALQRLHANGPRCTWDLAPRLWMEDVITFAGVRLRASLVILHACLLFVTSSRQSVTSAIEGWRSWGTETLSLLFLSVFLSFLFSLSCLLFLFFLFFLSSFFLSIGQPYFTFLLRVLMVFGVVLC